MEQQQGWRWHLGWRSMGWGLATLGLLAMSACGSSSTDATDPPTPPESHWLAAEVRSAGTSQLLAWRSDTPSQRSTWKVTSGSVQQVPILRWDATQRTVTTQGHGRAFFLADQTLHLVELRAGLPHTARTLAAAGRVCQINTIESLDSVGAAALVAVKPVAADGSSCADTLRLVEVAADGQVSTQDATDERWLSPLRLADGQWVGLLVARKEGFVERAALRLRGSNEPATWLHPATLGTPPMWLGQDATTPGLGYLRLGDQLWALRWNAQGASLDTPALANLSNMTTVATQDRHGVYFNTGFRFWHAHGGVAHPVAQLSKAAASGYLLPDQLVATQHHLVFRITGHPDPTMYTSVISAMSVAKSGGEFRQLMQAWPDVMPSSLSVMAAVGDAVALRRTWYASWAGNFAHASFIVSPDQGQPSEMLAGSWIGLTRNAKRVQGALAPVNALLMCGEQSTCSGADVLWQWQVATRQRLNLGALGASAQINTWQEVDNTASTTLVLPDAMNQNADVWRFTPGQAGSLSRQSFNLN